MGRYSTRFQGGGSNAVGATYTAAAGGGNSKFAVAANGQSLNRADYPALSAFYSGQSSLATFSLTNIANGVATQGIMFGQSTSTITSQYGGGERAATFSGFTIHIQAIQNRDNTSERNSCVWYTTNGEDWKVTDLLSPPVGINASFITTSSAVYLCHASGLSRTTNGLNFTGIYTTGVVGLAELNGTIIFTTGGDNVLRTTDFSTFTSIPTITGFSTHAIVNYSGVLYAFQNNSTSVIYSTDTGTTWQIATSGLSSAAGYGAKVIANYLIVSTVDTAGNPVYQYSTNPTGTTNTWTNIGVNKSTAYNNNFITHYLYDSTDDVLVCGLAHQLQGTTSAGKLAVRITGITGSAFTFSGSNSDLNYNNTNNNNLANYPFMYQSGQYRRFHFGYLCSYEPGSGWLDSTGNVGYPSGRINLDGNNTAIRPNPFFRPLGWGNDGFYSIGTTNSGSRYTYNGNSNNQGGTYGPMRYFALYVEESGFFKPLKATSTGYFANINPTSSTNAYPCLPDARNNLVLNEASGNYICAWTWTGNSVVGTEPGVYYNTYNQQTRQSTGNVSKYNTANYIAWTSPSTVVGGTKSDGIYVIGQYYNSAGNGNDIAYIAPNGTVTLLDYQTRFAGSYGQVFFSDVDNEVIVSRWSTSSVTGDVAIFSGGSLKTSGIYSLINSTGGTLSTITSGSTMVKTEGKYYVFDSSGNLYGGTSPLSLNYIKSITSSTNLNNSSNYMVYRELGTGLIYGTLGLQSTFGIVNGFQTRANNSYLNYNRNRAPEYFRFSGNASYIETPGYGDCTTFTTQGTGVFIVPNIVSTTTGEAKYIIAR